MENGILSIGMTRGHWHFVPAPRVLTRNAGFRTASARGGSSIRQPRRVSVSKQLTDSRHILISPINRNHAGRAPMKLPVAAPSFAA